MEHSPLLNVLYYLAAAVVAVPIFRRLGLGAILGYLAAGALIGPQGLYLIDHPEEALHFAEFGVVMLLFVIGLELNPEKLWSMRKRIALLGGGQLLLSALAVGSFCLLLFDFSVQIAALMGLTVALSSTAFAVQLMDEQGVMGSQWGRKGFSILLLQDMAVIPILLLVDFWAPQTASDSPALPWWLGPFAVLGVLLFGRFCLNPCLRMIARYGSREVLSAAALLIVLGTASLMQHIGLSMGMGAFLAGIILANSSFRHQLEADIEPFKGLLLGLFFIAVGMTLDLALLAESPLLIIALALALMSVKTLIIMVLVHFRSNNWKQSLLLGLMLSQGGEFAFVVMSKAVSLNLIESAIADYLVLIVGVSMALTSPLVVIIKRFTREKPTSKQDPSEEIINEEPEVIIAGFGRFGQIVGRILSANHIHFAALDKDASHVEFVKSFGNRIYFGDATRYDLMQAAGIDHARVVVIAVDGIADSLKIVRWLQHSYPAVTIIARAHNRMHAYQLKAQNVDIIIREALEGSLIAASETLMGLGFTEGQAISKVEIFRKHDQELFEKAAQHKDDGKTLRSIARQGREELEALFKQDENL